MTSLKETLRDPDSRSAHGSVYSQRTRPNSSKTGRPSTSDASEEEFWRHTFNGLKKSQRPLQREFRELPMSLKQESFIDFSAHKDILKAPRTYRDIEKEMAWKRAFPEKPTVMESSTIYKDSFSKLDYRKHRDMISPAVTHATIARMRDLQKAKPGSRGTPAFARSFSDTRLAAAPDSATETSSFRMYSPAEMACARSVPVFTSWHEHV
mmetsp:Transcript_68643/g.108883  ORF Transcript_68643/g.108883 Transcript_68643/m.108883 type:complete len:209 (+) Transcript_68643:39-665(+)|eukprot:CAMPEP_0169269338 /NCGR_PEP_ID=MMETSP1016-20121227/48380_1 /TAXON_ID=342587 /ORGANISM="Karlodinium micrum, Strain CCMP2283" /LENGTH=208 /DNA_ID=CAMNT_0009354309 /DNA_START=103 /DNA_END=729 /DNA_ORIENTATION=+